MGKTSGRALLARLQHIDLERTLAIARCEQLASRVMVVEAELRQVGRSNARLLDRYIDQERAAKTARAALDAATHKPAQLARLVLHLERLLFTLARRRCASCKIAHGHRPRCRVVTALRMISGVMGWE